MKYSQVFIMYIKEGVFVDRTRISNEPVKFNYLTTRGRYLILTDKTGFPSAQYKSRSAKGVIVHNFSNSSADPGGS